jgi:peroxiredoxin
MKQDSRPAPEWVVEQWLNTETSLTLAALRGRVIAAGAFQMLCPGCVSELIPQLRQAQSLFKGVEVSVLGLHTVFEHHDAMGPVSLKAFLHENRITFPVAIDQPQAPKVPIPKTMELYAMQGTPTMLLIDRDGKLRRQTFGHIPDMQLGAEIMALLNERNA